MQAVAVLLFVPSSAAASGSAPAAGQCSAVEHGKMYISTSRISELSYGPVTSPEECCQTCTEHDECVAYVWNETQKYDSTTIYDCVPISPTEGTQKCYCHYYKAPLDPSTTPPLWPTTFAASATVTSRPAQSWQCEDADPKIPYTCSANRVGKGYPSEGDCQAACVTPQGRYACTATGCVESKDAPSNFTACNAWCGCKAEQSDCDLSKDDCCPGLECKRLRNRHVRCIQSGAPVPPVPYHYEDPNLRLPSSCLADEKELSITGVAGSVCAAACQTDADCPRDVPLGATALPRCAINDPVGAGKSCVLDCAEGACGPSGGQCRVVGSGVSVCTYGD